MKIIGLGHYSRVGKDSLAKMIVKELATRGIQADIWSFAWKLKDVSFQLYGWAGLRQPSFYETEEGAALRHVKLDAIGLTPIEVWVKLGNAVRNEVYGATWIDNVLNRKCENGVVVIPDVRFTNEVDAIRQKGGMLVKVIRPGFGPLNTPSDLALMGCRCWDMVVGESGQMSELSEAASNIAAWIAGVEECPAQTGQEIDRLLAVEQHCFPN